MSQTYILEIDKVAANGIANAQHTIKDIPLILNGTLASSTSLGKESHLIDFYSPNDMTAVSFTINGYLNNKFITEVVIGPNDATVQSNNRYNRIESIIPNALQNVNNITVGTSYTNGNDIYLVIDSLNIESNKTMQWAIQTICRDVDILPYASLLPIHDLKGTYEEMIAAGDVTYYPYMAAPVAIKENRIYPVQGVFRGLIFKVTINVQATASCKIIVLQA